MKVGLCLGGLYPGGSLSKGVYAPGLLKALPSLAVGNKTTSVIPEYVP